jgi:alpha-N-arabinofuranosidase
MNMKKIKVLAMIVCCLLCISVYGQKKKPKVSKQITQVSVSIPENPASINPMIYGQMLEDCNDEVIYGGVVSKNGDERPQVTALLKELNIPIVRWPGGTFIHEYHWENGTGPKQNRPVVPTFAWGGIENYQFGTDEFLSWCKQVGTTPYINFNMGNKIYGGSLGDAMNWLEYVNGSKTTVYGQKRMQNGHLEPYDVKFWCIGNENYGPWGRHNNETAKTYADRLHTWATVIKQLYPNIHLLGVGHTYNWNDTILQQNASLIDFLTLHFYMKANVKDNLLEDEVFTLFSPVKIELQIRKNTELLNKINAQFDRTNNPVRFSIDEWNCRHSVFNGQKYEFTRKNNRRQFDVTSIAGMLHVMIRQSPFVGMANYIFPVNGHGLVKTVGETDAYLTPPYHVFNLYRKYMIGSALETLVEGATVTLPVNKLKVDGDVNAEANRGDIELTYVDAVSVQANDGNINVALINRSHNESQKIKIKLPEGYIPIKMWRLESDDINKFNSENNRDEIVLQETVWKKNKEIILSPCGLILIQYTKAENK